MIERHSNPQPRVPARKAPRVSQRKLIKLSVARCLDMFIEPDIPLEIKRYKELPALTNDIGRDRKSPTANRTITPRNSDGC